MENQQFVEKKLKQRKIVVHDKENVVDDGRVVDTKAVVDTSPMKFDCAVREQAPRSIPRQPHQPKKSMASRSNMEFKVNAMKVAELRDELKKRGYSYVGKKVELRSRLLDAMFVELDAEGSIEMAQPIQQTAQSTQPQNCQAHAKDVQESVASTSVKTSNNEQSSEKSEEMAKSPRVSETRKMSIDSVQLPEKEPEQHTSRESISSMQVEHHSVALGSASRDSTTKMSVECFQQSGEAPKAAAEETQKSSASNSSGFKLPAHASDERPSQKSVEPPISAASEHKKLCDSSPKAVTVTKKEINKQMSMDASNKLPARTKEIIKAHAEASDESDDDSVSAPPSELSSLSKASGSRVKELASKFSGTTCLSSTMSAARSATKPVMASDLKAIRDARMASAVKMQEKVRNCLLTNGCLCAMD
jgi:hypothetical protein